MNWNAYAEPAESPSRATHDCLRSILEKYGLEVLVMTKGRRERFCSPEIRFQATGREGRPWTRSGRGIPSRTDPGLLRKEPFPEILGKACEVAAQVCSHAGAVPA